jgi:flagellar motor component MotA
MTHDEFIAEYYKVSARAIELSEKARSEGLLTLEDFIDFEKADQRDIFEYGLIFMVDGTDSAIIREMLSFIIEQEEDKYTSLLMRVKLEAVLSIQAGENTRVLAHRLNALTDLSLKNDPIIQKLKDEDDDKGKYTREEIDALIGGLN